MRSRCSINRSYNRMWCTERFCDKFKDDWQNQPNTCLFDRQMRDLLIKMIIKQAFSKSKWDATYFSAMLSEVL